MYINVQRNPRQQIKTAWPDAWTNVRAFCKIWVDLTHASVLSPNRPAKGLSARERAYGQRFGGLGIVNPVKCRYGSTNAGSDARCAR